MGSRRDMGRYTTANRSLTRSHVSLQVRGTSTHKPSAWLSRSIQRRVPYRSALWFGFTVQVLANAVDWAICILAPCPVRDVGVPMVQELSASEQISRPPDGEPLATVQCAEQYALALLVRNGAMLLSTALVLGHFGYRLAKLLPYQQHHLPCWVGSLVRRLDLKQRADFWVAAASHELFRETEHVLQAGNQITGLLLLPVLAVLLVSNGVSIGPEYAEEKSRSAGPDDVFSCQGGRLCLAAALLNARLISINAMILVIASASFHTSPPLLWSRSVKSAYEKVGSLRMQQLQAQPWLLSVASLGLLVGLCIYVPQNVQDAVSPSSRITLFFEQLWMFLFLLFVLWRGRTPGDLAALFISEPPAGSFPPTSSTNGPAGSGQRCSKTIWQRLTYVAKHSEYSIGELQEALLMVQLILWSERAVSGTTLLETVLVYTIRAGLALLTFTAREKETTPKDLGTHRHLNFGLVVQASALRAALRGDAPSRIPLYSATVHRMQETLAVSYRWQDHEKEIMPGLSLNMSPFQMDALAGAIGRTGCRYLWLDKLSVPQDHSPVKEALLARMMGVYSSARVTLAIRTLESPGSRYHQRAWTFQEFCTSSRLIVATERATGAEPELSAVEPGEDAHFRDVRADCHRGMDELEPLWLRSGDIVTEEQAEEIVQRYQDISGRLNCLYPGDKLRALVPLLAQAPVESQQELQQLLSRISAASGSPATSGWMRLLTDSQSASSMIKAHPSLLEGIGPEALPEPSPAYVQSAGHILPGCDDPIPALEGHDSAEPSGPEMPSTQLPGLILN